ncbi:hypothetical protein IW492_05715 [Enterococcus sp. BWB1-3]|uniref:hypothetical protein n=1 Tax=Enterococcus sp. BWB1-3 TaxID=2787713 RepID=UPI001921A873|nr:hypothetical protein [Enterococcus sp. BWB1-3]MBL1228729.1 hypothetical protein [Enterococcus sp. BWB1-3]
MKEKLSKNQLIVLDYMNSSVNNPFVTINSVIICATGDYAINDLCRRHLNHEQLTQIFHVYLDVHKETIWSEW